MKQLILIAGLLIPFSLSAQDTITFANCIEKAVENSPRLRDRQSISEEGSLAIENIKSAWYPSLVLNGKVSYQSDVVSLEISDPAFPFSFPQMPNEQFGVNIDLKQTIYDGGLSKQKKDYEQATTAAALQKIDVDIHSIKEQVSNLYFTILLLQENRNTLEIALENLKAREKVLVSAVANGIAEQSDQQVLAVEILRVMQSLSEIDAARMGALQMLEIYMGEDIEDGIHFQMPYIEIPESAEILRPELQLFEMQARVLDAGKNLTSVKRLPQVFAFGQAGVGMPGYNMLNDQVDSYYMLGAGLQWNIWDWNNTKREKQILEKKKQVVLNSSETFSMNISAAMQKELNNMKHFKNSLNLDDQMLEMRIGISANAASKLDNGILSATDYLQILNEENRTRIGRSTHKIQLIKAIANYNLLLGTL